MASWIDKWHEKFASSSIKVTDQVPDVAEWKRFLNSLKKSDDCVDVAYNKYLCRMYFFSAKKQLIMNVLGFGALFVELAYMLVSNKKLKPARKGLCVLEKARQIPNFDDVVPEELFTRFEKVEVAENYNKKFGVLCKEARALWFRCFRKYPFQFFFLYFVYMELAAHSHFLLTYNPEATVVYVNERNVASSVITELYEQGDRKFISFMHGEYLLQLIQGYMSFSEYYIWDAFYADMFANDLNCKIREYKVYTPKKLQKKWDLENHTDPEYFCTYYFSAESTTTVMKVAEIFKEFEAHGKKCKVRPHPRFMAHFQEILKEFDGLVIENAREVPLRTSLEQTRYAVGLMSTVLSEAKVEGREIVIDDKSDVPQFASMEVRRSAALNREHILLSELYQSVLKGDN